MALGLQVDNPEYVRHQMNVFCVFTLYLGETCCLHLQGKLPCFANIKNYDISLSLSQCISSSSSSSCFFSFFFSFFFFSSYSSSFYSSSSFSSSSSSPGAPQP